MISMAECTWTDVVFSHRDIDGTDRHFHITRLLQRVAQGDIPVMEVPVDHDFAMHAAANFGLEMHRFNRLTEKSLRTPVLFAGHKGAQIISGMEALLIDGTHRYVWAAVHGIPTIKAFIIPSSVWEDYLVDIPQDINDRTMEDVVNQTAKSYLP